MRAELFPRPVTALQVIIVLSLTLIASGCKTEKDPDQPTILGIPPGIAYLGVEYSYNFGAYGGEDILDYSLTNAPSWLALEGTSNKARQGIIMRGVPGLNGGARGEADLGKTENINLVSTDGQMAGAVPFDIQVKYNVLSLEADSFKEGDSPSIPDSNRERCELPDLEAQGEHSFSVNTYNDDGSVNGTQELTLPTRPVFVKVLLDRPSVTEVAVAFELESNFDPESCDDGFSDPHQRCDHGRLNTGDAILGSDIVAFGSESESLLEDIPYLSYETDSSGAYPGVYTGGVITLKPGITECYIRLEVVDDSFPEPTEIAQLRLKEVRSGLAALGPRNSGVGTSLIIDDNEPKVSLETVNGGTRDTLNVGDSRSYVARLTGEREGPISARLSHSEDSAARIGTEFTTNLTNNELSFPVGTDELTFEVTVQDPAGYANDGPDDRFILMGLDTHYQLGRENYARTESEDMLRISLNERTAPLVVGSSGEFVATDVAVGHDGKMFVAGYDRADNDRVFVKIYDQKGALVQPPLAVSEVGDQLATPEPVIGLARREVIQSNSRSIRYELVVAYSADGAAGGTTSLGGKDVVTSLYWFDEAINSGEYVETWTIRTGTDADDIVSWVGINPASGFIMIAGETNGVWPEQTSAGGFDSFLQRIDSLPDGNTFAPALAWTRQAGSSANDSVAGAQVSGGSPILFGSAVGAVNGEPSLGGEDVYFYSAASKEGDLNVRQRGTDADEQVADGVMVGTILWLLGNSSNQYAVEQGEENSRRLTSEPSSSQSGFMLGYTVAGDIVRSFNLNDESDVSDEQFAALTGFYGDLIAGGDTDGNFTGSAGTSGMGSGILARVSLTPEDKPDAEPPAYRNEWRFQMSSVDSEVTRLANYRDDEIVALARIGTDWVIVLLSPEGELLTP